MTTAVEHENYLTTRLGWKSWFFTRDHKRIALLFLLTVTFFFFVGGTFATLIRLELMTPQADLFTSETYNKLFSMHGIIMVWFFLIPSIPTVFGNFLIPMMIGARDLAFPRLNLLSWYLLVLGGLFELYAILSGGIDTGWTFYTPYSSQFANTHVVAALIGIFVSGFSSILTGLNFITTIHKLRAPGLYWWRLPIFVWTIYATSFIFLLAVPVLAMALLLEVLERGVFLKNSLPKFAGKQLHSASQ